MTAIVSLIPSATEIVCALGLGEYLVGRSHECDFPAWVKRLPVLTEPKINIEGMSAVIDRQVKSVLEQALSVYRVDAARLRELRPDYIVTQSQCEVCAVSPRDVEQALSEWLGRRPQVIALAPNALSDVMNDIVQAAQALDVPDRGRECVRILRERMATIASRARASEYRPTVACIEWIDPLMAAGNWMPELVEMAGGRNLFGQSGQHSPWLAIEELVAADPDLILVMPCGFTIERSITELQPLAASHAWQNLTAVRNHQVFVADGNQYFNRPGPRLAESLEILAEVFHPELFAFGHEQIGWRRWANLTGRTQLFSGVYPSKTSAPPWLE